MDERIRYRQVVRYVGETPWAVRKATLATIRDLVEFRARGGHLSAEEIQERIGAARPKPVQPRGGSVAVIPLHGVIVPHAGSLAEVSGAVSVEGFLAQFRSAVADDQVSTVLIDVDSPGGAVDLVAEAAAEIRAARARKRIVAVANTDAASAAYWLAAQAEELVVTPSGKVGSVGVYSAHEDISKMLDDEGVKVTLISAGDNKTEESPFEPLTDEARAAIQHRVDSYYRMFVADVAKGRGVDAATVEANYGQGRIVLAQDALRAGMVDRVATFDQALAQELGGPAGRRRPRAAAAVIREEDPELYPGLTAVEVSGPIASHSTATSTGPWDGQANRARLRNDGTADYYASAFAWRDDDADPETKEAYKFIHHDVADNGDVGAANVNGCSQGIAVLNGARSGTTIPDDDRQGVYDHLARHLRDAGREPPPLQEATSSAQVEIPIVTRIDGGRLAAAIAHYEAGGVLPTGRTFATNTTNQAVTVVSMDGATASEKKEERTMRTREELVARMEEIKARQQELDTEYAGQRMPDDAQAEFDGLEEEYLDIDATIKNIDDRKRRLERKAAVSGAVVPADGAGASSHGRSVGADWSTNADTRKNLPSNVFDVSAYRQHARSVDELVALYREGASRINDGLAYETSRDDDAKAHVERLLGKDTKDGEFALRILDTGSPMYERAFGKMLMGRPLTTQEDGAIKAAISHTGLGSEVPVPVTIDPTIIMTSDGAANPLRRISRNVTTTGPTWQGISSDGVSVVYEAELSEVADQTPSFAAPSSTVKKAHGYVEFSIEVDQDWGSLRANLAQAFQEAKDEKEAEKFLTGSGTNEPHGIITALAAGSSDVDTAAIGTLALDDLDAVINGLPPRFDANAQWVGNRAVFGALRALAGDRTDFWVPLAQGFRNRDSGATGYTLLDYPVNIASGMSSDSTTGGSHVLILGDFGRGFLVHDRVGLNVELIPHVLGTNRRPKGARALYAYFRNNSEVLVEGAFRMLTIRTS